MSEANFQDAQNPYSAPYAEVGVKPGLAGPVLNFRGYAGFWIRVLAYILDNLIVGVVFNVLNFAVGGVILALGLDPNQGTGLAILGAYMIFAFLAIIGYYAGMESSSKQATLGKMALGLKVVDLQGRRISFGRALGRLFSKILSALIIYIGFIMVAFTERKQGLHDMIAGTLVIKTR